MKRNQSEYGNNATENDKTNEKKAVQIKKFWFRLRNTFRINVKS